MDIFELHPNSVEQLRSQGFDLLEKANAIYAGYFFPECDLPPILEWSEITAGVHLLLDDFSGRDFEVFGFNHLFYLLNPTTGCSRVILTKNREESCQRP